MVLALDLSHSEPDVVNACIDAYRMRSQQVSRLPLSALAKGVSDDDLPDAIVSPAEHRVEIVCRDENDLETCRKAATRLATTDWDVTVLAPLALSGTSHERLRGLPVQIQHWWMSDQTIQFGRPEIP